MMDTGPPQGRPTMPTTPAPGLRHVPHLAATIAHLLLLAGAYLLFLGRKPGRFRSETVLELVPGFYSHISNFSLSYLLYAGVGFLWLMMGVPLRWLAAAGLALIAANLVYEFLIPVLNTRDPVDAAYGVVGTVLAFAVLWLIRRFGLMPSPDAPVR